MRRVCREKFASSEYFGLDTETTSFDPYTGKLRLIQLSDGKETIVVDLNAFAEKGDLKKISALDGLREILSDEDKVKFIHNAKFDVKWIQYFLDVEVRNVFDTMLASQLLAAGDPEKRHSLAEVAFNYLQLEVDKTEQTSDWDSFELTESQLKYAAFDAFVAHRLGKKLEEAIFSEGLNRVAQLEFACVVPLATVEMNGIALNKELWQSKLEEAERKKQILAESLRKSLKTTDSQTTLFSSSMQINLDDQSQVLSALSASGIPVSAQTTMRELSKLANEYPQVASFVEYQELQSLTSNFGRNFLDEMIKPQTGRIHGDYKQIGNFSGQIKSYKPNLQQIPPEYRECFVASEGKKLITAVYEDLEPRVLAFISADQEMMKAFKDVENPYRKMASDLFEINISDVSDDHIAIAKRLSYAVVYGAGASYISQLIGVNKSEAENLMKRYFTIYPRLSFWIERTMQRAEDEKLCRSASGRIYRIRLDNEEKQRMFKRYARAFLVQAFSADLFKRALSLLHQNLQPTSAKIVNVFPNGVNVECDQDKTDEVEEIVKTTMKKAAEEFMELPVKIKLNTSDFWSL